MITRMSDSAEKDRLHAAEVKVWQHRLASAERNFHQQDSMRVSEIERLKDKLRFAKRALMKIQSVTSGKTAERALRELGLP